MLLSAHLGTAAYRRGSIKKCSCLAACAHLPSTLRSKVRATPSTRRNVKRRNSLILSDNAWIWFSMDDRTALVPAIV